MAIDVPRRMRALSAILALIVPLAGASALIAPPAPAAGVLVVGLEPAALPAVALAGVPGQVIATDPALGIALVRSPDVTSALRALEGAPGVSFVELDGAVLAAGVRETGARDASTRWDSTRWDSTRWDSTRWDAALWESTRWDSTRWDSTRWDSTRWDSTRWDSTRWDAALCESTRWDSTRWDSTRWDSTRWDASACDSTRWDSTRWDGNFTLDPLFAYQWGLRDLRVHEAWAYFQGLGGRTICVLDTGVDYTHPDLAPNMWTGADGAHGWDFVNGDADPMDDAGHGTHVAGVAAASVGNGLGVAGVGDEKIMAVKVLNHRGIGGIGTLAQGIRWCADNGANVLSMSLATTQASKALERAVQYAHGRGVLLVASAGNLDACEDCASYPAAYSEVVAVTALTAGAHPAAFSRPASHVELSAPGELIAGTFLDHDYALASGTSQSAALVSGLAALAWDVNPDLTGEALRAHLRASARDLGDTGWDPATGWGEPDAEALLLAIGAELGLG